MRIIILTILISISYLYVNAQANISSEDTEIYISDTLLIDPSQLAEIQNLPVEIQRTLTFKTKVDGYKVYHYMTGEKHSTGNIKNNKPDGQWKTYHLNGQVNKDAMFKDGVKEGKYIAWYPNGNKNAEGIYKNDLQEGKWTFFNKDGSLMGVYIYELGKIIKK